MSLAILFVMAAQACATWGANGARQIEQQPNFQEIDQQDPQVSYSYYWTRIGGSFSKYYAHFKSLYELIV